MKTMILALFVSFLSVHALAQDITYTRSGSTPINRFYAGIIGKTAALNGSWGLLGGMRIGYNIDENSSIGLSAFGLIPERLDQSYINRNGRNDMHLGYFGAEAVIKYHISKIVYLAGTMMVGAGRVNYVDVGGNDYFFIAEPGVSINYNITEFFGIGFSVDYRRAAGVKYADLTDNSLSGWSMDLAFNFGF
jgi:hypothetical protein